MPLLSLLQRLEFGQSVWQSLRRIGGGLKGQKKGAADRAVWMRFMRPIDHFDGTDTERLSSCDGKSADFSSLLPPRHTRGAFQIRVFSGLVLFSHSFLCWWESADIYSPKTNALGSGQCEPSRLAMDLFQLRLATANRTPTVTTTIYRKRQRHTSIGWLAGLEESFSFSGRGHGGLSGSGRPIISFLGGGFGVVHARAALSNCSRSSCFSRLVSRLYQSGWVVGRSFRFGNLLPAVEFAGCRGRFFSGWAGGGGRSHGL